MDLVKIIKGISVLDNKISQLNKSRTEKIDKLRNRIKNGESTGDNVADYIIYRTGQLSLERFEKQLRKLKEDIDKFQNEQVIVLYKTEHDMVKYIRPPSDRERGLFPHKLTHTETRWKLGVLMGELGFNFNSAEVGGILIPTKNYVEENNSKKILNLKSGGIPVEGYDIFNNLGENIPVEGYDIFNNLGGNLEILMGNNLVELCFKYYFNFPSTRNLFGGTQEKGVTIEGLPVDEESYKKYTEALELLRGKEQEITPLVNIDDLFRHMYK